MRLIVDVPEDIVDKLKCIETLSMEQEADLIDAVYEALDEEICEDAISRQAAIDAANKVIERDTSGNNDVVNAMIAWSAYIKSLPSVKPQEPKTDMLDKIRAEIEQNAYPIVHGVNNHEKGMTLYGILQIIDKYKAESEEV